LIGLETEVQTTCHLVFRGSLAIQHIMVSGVMIGACVQASSFMTTDSQSTDLESLENSLSDFNDAMTSLNVDSLNFLPLSCWGSISKT
jgi:hypothetical protein